MIENRGIIKDFNIKGFNPVPMAVFIFDCSRFLFLLRLLALVPAPGSGFGNINLPLMMYAAPNALFPLMSFFLLIRFDVSRAYIPLYIIGKVLGLMCVLIWLFFIRRIPEASIMWAVFLCAADAGTVMGTALRADYTLNGQEEKTAAIMAAPMTAAVDAVEGGE